MMAFPFLLDGDYVMHLVVRDVTARKAMEAAQRRQRRQLLTASAFLVLVLTIVGGYKFYHFTESTEFCGKLCHSVMEPDLRLHERSSHSHVTCAECHIGAGAAWYVKAKLSGLHQVWAVAARTYSKPIPSPLANLRPATETCEFCHSPRVFHGNRSKVFRRVADQGDPMDPEVTALLLRVGGYSPGSNSYSGIHWHAGPQSKVEFRAVDRSRLQIRDIRVTRESGKVDLYSNQRLPALPEDAPWRTMDCSDCHNRVPHQYLSAEQALDRLVLDGKLNPLLPDIKRAGLDALVATYDDSQRAREGIRRRLERHYLKTRPEVVRHKTADLDRTARVLYEQAFSSNVYPRLNIGWETYPDHNGHRNELGCFRCHDGEHRSAAGATVFQDCDPCHATVVEGVRESGIPEDVRRFLSW
jgi:nitrate/TMAO reductase-like tetraheme cytochrome c subunit